MRRRIWLAAALLTLIVGAAIWMVVARHSHAFTPAAMLERIPKRDAILLYVDFAALRRSGLLGMLTKSPVPEEPDYRAFVSETGFNYQSDLDAALLSFHPEGTFFLLRGRFDWKRLERYADAQGGACAGGLCRMQGSAPERRISFLPLAGNVMAMAVSTAPSAAARLKQPDLAARVVERSADPVWVSIPSTAFERAGSFSAGTQLFAKSIRDAESVTLSLGPERQRFRATLQVGCRSERDADALAAQLGRLTAILRESIAREKRAPDPRDLSGILTSGSFHREGQRVLGHWPIERAFLESTLDGSGQ